MILTNRHAAKAVETIAVVVIDACDVRTHIKNLLSVAFRAFNCFGFLIPSGLLIKVHLKFFFQVFIEPEHVEIGYKRQEFCRCWCGLRVVPMIHK